jgi:hypothetical protein
MKTRSGFVSNSSTSSFILYIPQDYQVTDKDYTLVKMSNDKTLSFTKEDVQILLDKYKCTSSENIACNSCYNIDNEKRIYIGDLLDKFNIYSIDIMDSGSNYICLDIKKLYEKYIKGKKNNE